MKPTKDYKLVKGLFDKLVKIETCCEILDSKRKPLNSEERKKIIGDIPYYGANGIQGYINKHIFDEDLILLAEDGGNFKEYQNKPIAYFISGKSWINNHAHVLKNKSNYDLKFIFYSLVHKNIISWINGTTRSKLNQSELRKIQILTPSLREQQKIASILCNVDALIESTQDVVDKSEKLKKGLMQKLLIKGIGHTKFKKMKWMFDKEIVVPENWEYKKIRDFFKLKSGGTPSRTKPEFFKGDVYWVTSGDLNRSKIKDTVEKITDFAISDTRLKLFPKGTFLIASYGLEASKTRGKCGILEMDATCNQACIAFLPSSKILSLFMFYFYLHFGEKIVFSIAQGTKQQNIYSYTLKKVSLFVPPLEEQQKIASILSGVDAYIQKNQEYKKKLKLLMKRITIVMLIYQKLYHILLCHPFAKLQYL